MPDRDTHAATVVRWECQLLETPTSTGRRRSGLGRDTGSDVAVSSSRTRAASAGDPSAGRRNLLGVRRKSAVAIEQGRLYRAGDRWFASFPTADSTNSALGRTGNAPPIVRSRAATLSQAFAGCHSMKNTGRRHVR